MHFCTEAARGDVRLLRAQEDVLELDHAGVGEQQGRGRPAAPGARSERSGGRARGRIRESCCGCLCSSWFVFDVQRRPIVQNGNDSTAGKPLPVEVAGERARVGASRLRGASLRGLAGRAAGRPRGQLGEGLLDGLLGRPPLRQLGLEARPPFAFGCTAGADEGTGRGAVVEIPLGPSSRSRASSISSAGKAALARAWPPAPAGNADGRRGAGRPCLVGILRSREGRRSTGLNSARSRTAARRP